MTDPRDDTAQLRSVAEQLASAAAAFVRTRRAEVFDAEFSTGDAVRTKSTPTDPVTVVDTETEALLRRRLAELRPGDAVLGEEGGGPADAVAAGAVTWVLDPIDGTVNFVYGIPVYAVSVAAQVDGMSVAGAVADVVSGEIYSAGKGLGADVMNADGRRALRCTEVSELSMALVGTGFGYSPRRRTAQARLLAGLLPQVRDVRRLGSAALDLCMVAAGRLNAHYEHGLHVWDWAAGALIASESGALVLVADEAVDGGLVLAGAPGVADALYDALRRLDGLAPLPS